MKWLLQRTDLILIFGLLIFGSVLLSVNIAKPFVGHHDWNGTQYGNMARNYEKYGLAITKLGQVENGGMVESESFAYNTHYLSTMPLILWVGRSFFGESEVGTRLVAVFFSLISVILVYLIGKELKNRWVGLIAAMLMLVTPMFRYFGKMPVHEPLILPAALAMVYFYISWSRGKGGWNKFFWSGVAAQAIGWPGYYMAPLLLICDRWVVGRWRWSKFLPVFLTGILWFLVLLFHNWWLVGRPFGGGLIEILLFRLGFINEEQVQFYGFDWREFIRQELSWVQVYLTRVQILLATMGLWFVSKNWKRYGIVIVLMIYGVTHALIFRNAAFIHEYMIFYLSPGIALAAALGWWWLVQRLPKLGIVALGIVAVILSFTERNQFYLALEDTRMHEIGKKVGEEIAKISEIDETTAVYPNGFLIDMAKFVAYYGDRNITSFDEGRFEPEDVEYLVVIKGYETGGVDVAGYTEGETIYYRRP